MPPRLADPLAGAAGAPVACGVMNDRQLAKALREGQPGAAAPLVQAHGECILQYCWLMLGDISAAAAVLHEIMAAAPAEAPFLDDSGSLRTWFLLLARRGCAVGQAGPPGGSPAAGRVRCLARQRPASAPAAGGLAVRRGIRPGRLRAGGGLGRLARARRSLHAIAAARGHGRG